MTTQKDKDIVMQLLTKWEKFHWVKTSVEFYQTTVSNYKISVGARQIIIFDLPNFPLYEINYKDDEDIEISGTQLYVKINTKYQQKVDALMDALMLDLQKL